MKRFVACLLAVLMVAAMLPLAAVAEGEQTVLRVTWWGSQARHDLTMAAIAKFEEKNPDIKIEPEFTDWGGYWSRLATQAAGGMLPDVIQMDYQLLGQYVQSGLLSEMDSYFTSGAINVSDIDASVIKSGQVDGVTYALSCGTNAYATFYRPDVLEAAGVELPMQPTYEDIVRICTEVYEKTGRTNDTPTNKDGVRMLLRSEGKDFFNEDGTALGFDDPSYLVRLWEQRLAAQEAGWCLKTDELTQISAYDSMVSDVWLSWHYSNELAGYEEGNGCELEMVCWPVDTDATTAPTFLKPSMFWSIQADSKVKDAAARFIDFFTNDPECYDIMGLDRAVPVSSKIRDYVAPKVDKAGQKQIAYLNYLTENGLVSPIYPADPTPSAEIETLLGEYWDNVDYGMVDDLTAYAQQFIDEANAILQKAAE